MPGSKIRQVEPDLIVVELSGHLNLGNELMSLESAVKRLIQDGARKLVMDLTKLDYIDSAGIGMLVGCNGQMVRAGGKMRVAGTIHLAGTATQHADPRAVDVIELGQIHHQLAGTVLNQALHRGFEAHQFVTEVQVAG